jgi:hypothetical protein
MRLWLIGDDEALDVLAELSPHLDYFEVARLDEPPARVLTAEDHLVVGTVEAARGRVLLDALLQSGAPGFATLLPALDGATAGARAIVVAAELVAQRLGAARG